MLYVSAVILLMIFLGGFLYFVCYAAIDQISTAMANQMSQYSGMQTYSTYQLANTFMANLWKLFLAVMLLGLGYWVYIYSQHKHAGVKYE